jgi:hypothetical protein
MFGGLGVLRGAPPEKVNEIVASSPSVTVSRSRVALKVAPRAVTQNHDVANAKSTISRSHLGARSSTVFLLSDNNFVIKTSPSFARPKVTRKASLGAPAV